MPWGHCQKQLRSSLGALPGLLLGMLFDSRCLNHLSQAHGAALASCPMAPYELGWERGASGESKESQEPSPYKGDKRIGTCAQTSLQPSTSSISKHQLLVPSPSGMLAAAAAVQSMWIWVNVPCSPGHSNLPAPRDQPASMERTVPSAQSLPGEVVSPSGCLGTGTPSLCEVSTLNSPCSSAAPRMTLSRTGL